MESLYNVNGLMFWGEKEISIREFFKSMLEID